MRQLRYVEAADIADIYDLNFMNRRCDGATVELVPNG